MMYHERPTDHLVRSRRGNGGDGRGVDATIELDLASAGAARVSKAAQRA
jgi:hypothetical protein